MLSKQDSWLCQNWPSESKKTDPVARQLVLLRGEGPHLEVEAEGAYAQSSQASNYSLLCRCEHEKQFYSVSTFPCRLDSLAQQSHCHGEAQLMTFSSVRELAAAG